MAKSINPTEVYQKWAAKAKKMNPKKLDDLIHSEHVSVFKKTDCLSCANCCKTTSPIFRDVDIQRISKHLRTTEQKFIATYLHMDSESDYVLNSSPCSFLGADNYCSIYEVRPLACREYPHTDRKNMYQLLNLTIKNTEICPAVKSILDKLIESKEFKAK
jgi:Fe-S-cluster containining protein